VTQKEIKKRPKFNWEQKEKKGIRSRLMLDGQAAIQ